MNFPVCVSDHVYMSLRIRSDFTGTAIFDSLNFKMKEKNKLTNTIKIYPQENEGVEH